MDAHPGAGPFPAEAAASPRAAEVTPGQFIRRASNVFLVLALASVVALLGALGTSGAAPGVAVAAAGAMALTFGLAALSLSIALDRGVPWAPSAAVLALWVVVVGGVVRLLVGLSAGSISLPLDSLLAAWALSSAGSPAARAPGRTMAAWALVGVIAMTYAAPPLLAVAGTPGLTPLVVGREAIEVRLSADCPPPGRAWDSIRLELAWRWSTRDLVPQGTDRLVIGVRDMTGDVHGWEMRDPVGPAFAQEGPGDARGTLDDPLVLHPGQRWWIDVSEAGLPDGSVAVSIVPASGEPVASGAITFVGGYMHDQHWVVESEATCAW